MKTIYAKISVTAGVDDLEIIQFNEILCKYGIIMKNVRVYATDKFV